VKQNNNNSEGVDGNEQCSSNVKEASNPQRTKCTSTAKVRKWDDTHSGVDPVSKFRGGDFSNIWQSSLITGSLL